MKTSLLQACYTLFLCTLLCAGTSFAETHDQKKTNRSGLISWQNMPAWNVKGKVTKMVHTLDGKKVFMLTEEHTVEIYTTNGTHLGSIPVDAGVSNMDISPIGDILYLVDNEKGTFLTLKMAFKQEIPQGNSPTKGSEKAPIKMVVFTDFQCPFCKKLPPVLDKVLEKNEGKVQLIFKNLPLISIHPFAKDAALAAIAAQNQNKFWEYHDKLFSAKQLEPGMFEDCAEELGLDMKQFKHDMASPETERHLRHDMMTAQQANVDGTPSIFINGWPMEDRTIEALQNIINVELEKN